jgi:uncharacterized membrane protein (UPF0136 family)
LARWALKAVVSALDRLLAMMSMSLERARKPVAASLRAMIAMGAASCFFSQFFLLNRVLCPALSDEAGLLHQSIAA